MKALFKNFKLFGIFVVALSLFVSLSGFPLAVSAQTSIETDFMNILNTQRIALGKNSLAINSSLSTAAYLHSKDMAENNYFSHTSPDGQTMVQRVTAAGYTDWTSLGENIAYCYGASDATTVYDMWENSPGHYANMIGDFTDAGLGVYTLNNYTYYTLDLGENITPGSSDATLSNLTISSGTLTPGFTSGITSYTDSVANNVNAVIVTPTVNQANAIVTVDGTPVTSGSLSGAISLNAGSNNISVVVTAQDGVTQDVYTITITLSGAVIQGTTYGANGVILGGVTLTLDGATQVTSASDGTYQLIVTTTGSHTIVATDTGYGSQTQTANVLDLTATYPLSFDGDNGLVPNTPSVSFVLACTNKWKYPPADGTGLDISKVLSVINAWKFPVN